jgi:hypothetical protein
MGQEAAGVYDSARAKFTSYGIKVVDAKYMSERMVRNLAQKGEGTHIIIWCWSGRCGVP